MARSEDQVAIGEPLLPLCKPPENCREFRALVAFRICTHSYGRDGCRCALENRRPCEALERIADEILSLLPISAAEFDRRRRRGRRG